MAFRKFNHLNVPEHWERYFTKYPQGMTILESLFEWVSQVDNMVDNVNEWNSYLDKFVKEFDKELQATVTTILIEWQQSGFLDIIIDEALQTQIDDVEENLNQRAINIKDYGAKGDGVTDDTLAIQAALDTRQPVFIPQGNYVVTDTLLYYTKQIIEGVGDTSNIISQISGKPVMKNAEPFFNTHFTDFRIEGNGAELNGIEMLKGFEHFYIDRLSIVGVGGNGLHLDEIYGLYANGLHIIGLSNTQYGLYAYGCNGCKISDSLFKSCKQGIHTDWTYKFTIKDNIIESNDGTGLYMKRPNMGSVKDNYFENNGVITTVDNAFDIHVDEDQGLVTNGLRIEDNYARSNNVIHTIKLKTILNNVKISNFYVIGFEKEHQKTMFNIDVLNTGVYGQGLLYLENMSMNNVDTNEKNKYIIVDSAANPFAIAQNVKLYYMDGTTGKTIAGEIPCTVFCRYVEHNGLTTMTFEVKSFNITNLPLGRIVGLGLPKERQTYTGYFTGMFDYGGTDPEVAQVYGLLDFPSDVIILKKIGTPTEPSTRFDINNLTNTNAIKGSLTYY